MTAPKLATARSGYGGRGYYIPGHHEPGGDPKKPKRIIYPSVTTVLKQVAKEALYQWIADQTAAYAVANVQYLLRVQEEVGYGLLRWYWSRKPAEVGTELRTHYERVRDDRAELGTNIHEWGEAHLNAMPYPELQGWEAEEMAEQLERWLDHHEVIPNATEFTVVNTVEMYAGTGDADWTIVCLHDGPTCLGQPDGEAVRALVDLKTSRHVWKDHGMQVAALAQADRRMIEVAEGTEGALRHEATEKGVKRRSWWLEEANPSYDRVALLHIRPRDRDTEGEKIEAFCRMVDKTPDRDVFWSGFRGARMLAEMEKELNRRAKARGESEEESW